ncbi:MAG: glutamyl-tRNA reductase [Verrucomicrobiales bacterium]|nr:glutamyl-tRNA reductase [Verrucomicrobiales bacterium]
MSIFCLGVNHKTAPVEIREKLAFAEKTLPDSLREILGVGEIEETVILSTCNRVEVYGAASLTASALDSLSNFLIGHFDVDGHEVEFYRHESEQAAHHLFEVASGLDSMVLGETEIFGQVKKAYATAQEAGATGKRMNKLFQQSFSIGKLVRSNSKIQHGSTSIGSVAVDLAEKIFGDLTGCKVMIVGAGEMSRTTAQSMVSRGASGIIVSNRSYDKAVELAELLNGSAMRFDDWETALRDVDILISSTSAPHPIIHAKAVDSHMKERRGNPLLLIDIAVPRDIEDEVRHIGDAYLFNIDQLTKIAEEGKSRREEQILFCRNLIAEHIEEKGIAALKSIPGDTTDRPPLDTNRPITNP